MTMLLLTNSAMSDQIREAWRMTRTEEYPICGDYYYDQIDSGILFNKRIEIKSEHLPKKLRDHIQTLDPKIVQKVLLRAILEIFEEKHPGLVKLALAQNRISVRYE